MNRYILIHRLRVPAFLLLIGVLALLHQLGVLDHFWRLFWPLAFILAGSILLAERFALNIDGFPPMPYPGAPVTGATNYGASNYQGQAAAPNPAQTTAIVPAESHGLDKNPDGGQS
ncbi:MAG: DUF5668 domain-containing protein [Terracidiphilus sp.]|jgi:hypothetical protein